MTRVQGSIFIKNGKDAALRDAAIGDDVDGIATVGDGKMIASSIRFGPYKSDLPYGVPVKGKPGYVMSPYSRAGYVDVRGLPSGIGVKDPYSGKIFLVPQQQ